MQGCDRSQPTKSHIKMFPGYVQKPPAYTFPMVVSPCDLQDTNKKQGGQLSLLVEKAICFGSFCMKMCFDHSFSKIYVLLSEYLLSEFT